MYKPVQVKDNLFYVGVNDRTKHLFAAGAGGDAVEAGA